MDKHPTISLLDGHSMPVIGVGTWQLQDAAATITTALELGYTMIDTSGNYGTQPGIAQGLKTAGKSPGHYFITTKTENDQVPIDSLKRSLDELGLESVDLTLIH